MKAIINCFIPFKDKEQVVETVKGLQETGLVNKIYLLSDRHIESVDGCELLPADSLNGTSTMKGIASHSDSEYSLVYTKYTVLQLGEYALERMLRIAHDTQAAMLYADHYQVVKGNSSICPVIDYQPGSLRDDFDFGSVLLYRADLLRKAVDEMDKDYRFAGLYDLRLRVSCLGELVHINEYLYSEVEHDARKSGEKIFDYVDPKNRQVQIEMESACTEHLKRIGGYLKPEFKDVVFNEGEFEYEASVIIPVRNRIRTIEDAIRSVLCQDTDFKFNLIIIDNHSTDGTSKVIGKYSADERLIHIIPSRYDLGIGGCWNEGVNHPKCGKFAVQLDSDDVYKDKHTLQTMVDAFYEQNCAMVVGTYMMTDFNMNMIAPGVIDHKEWTSDNGRNNALRINGLGAPRAFYTPVLREVKVPNTSYGEDYALGLNISREYRIGRVYDVVYLCRRWEDNSDASLDVTKMNAHNTYKDRIRTWELQARIALNKKAMKRLVTSEQVQELFKVQLENWQLARENYLALGRIKTKRFQYDDFEIHLQFNPARLVSSAAKTDNKSLKERKCFLCPANLPEEQRGLPFGDDYQVLVNPFPIFPEHFTIPLLKHLPQSLSTRFEDMLDMATALDKYVIFYNGPRCGASAPDHAHFQAGNKGFLPIEKEWKSIDKELLWERTGLKLYTLKNYLRSVLIIESEHKTDAAELFKSVYEMLEVKAGEEEPMFNVLTWREEDKWIVCLFLREKHRPACYSIEGDGNLLLSPGAVDMGGVLIIPLEKDFEKITKEDVSTVFREVRLNDMDKLSMRLKREL